MVFRPRSVTIQLTARILNPTEVTTHYLLAYGLALKSAPALFKKDTRTKTDIIVIKKIIFMFSANTNDPSPEGDQPFQLNSDFSSCSLMTTFP